MLGTVGSGVALLGCLMAMSPSLGLALERHRDLRELGQSRFEVFGDLCGDDGRGREIVALPDELEAVAQAVAQEPAFVASFGVVPAGFGIVDLDRLVVFQKNINLEYVRELQKSIPSEPTTEDLFHFCMAPAGSRPPVRRQRVGPNAFVFVSESTDFRFLGPELLTHEDVPTSGGTGHPTSIVSLPVGYGSNYLNVVAIDGRLVLNNGSHRAYALRDIAQTTTPVLIQRITRAEELEVVGPQAVHANPRPYIEHPRPPLLKDYFDPALRRVVQTPHKARQVKVTFNVETFDVPG